jgi:hypothetical protein
VDIGAGAGLLGIYLARDRGQARYLFVEPLESLERHLEAQFGEQANARTLTDYRSAHYLALLDVLEHQPDDEEFLRELVSKMGPGAQLIITVPAMQQLWSQWDVDLGHYRRYSKQTLAGAVSKLPIDIIEMSYLFPEMVPAALLRKRRRPAADGLSASPESALFPDLPPAVNAALFVGGSMSLAARRWIPMGSSLVAVLRKRDEDA